MVADGFKRSQNPPAIWSDLTWSNEEVIKHVLDERVEWESHPIVEGARVEGGLVELIETYSLQVSWNRQHPTYGDLNFLFLHDVVGILQAHQTLELVRGLCTKDHTLVSPVLMFVELCIDAAVIIYLPQPNPLPQW